MEPQPPLVLCMESANGEEVSMQIEPGDDFHVFLVKAKSLLGYDVDINSITRNQPVALTDNIYQFLLKSEQTWAADANPPLPPNNEDLYILDDGTQIRASQIHFDNEDPPVDLTAEEIPFVKYNDALEPVDDVIDAENRRYNIVGSPVGNDKDNLVIPFRIVCNSTSGFEAQFTQYLEANCKSYATLNTVTNRNKSPRSLIRDNFKNYDRSHRGGDEFTHYTREEILNMFKDSPVASLPYDNQGLAEKRRHVRKSDHSRLANKKSKPISYVDVDGVLIAESESQNCFICNKHVDNTVDKLYLFDNEDQRLHRSSPQRKMTTELKIICEQCLNENFKPSRMKSPNQSLNSDEFLVIRNNQQYIFEKTNALDFNFGRNLANVNALNENVPNYYNSGKSELLKVEVGSDGEIVTNIIEKESDDVEIVKDEKKESSSDVEIIENGPEMDDNIIDNLEEADEEVIEFLGKYQCDGSDVKELKCRFCELKFTDLPQVIDHGDKHKHVMDDGAVFPCPLCDYGYANFKWLKGHLKTAHDKPAANTTEEPVETKPEGSSETIPEEPPKVPDSPIKESSPIAKRTRSCVKNNNISPKEAPKTTQESKDPAPEPAQLESKFVIKTEVKQEAVESSDEEIWIVHTADDEADHQLKKLLDAAKNENNTSTKKHKCDSCNHIYSSAATLSTHKCRPRSSKESHTSEGVICVPTKEDFYKRAQGRPRNLDDSGENDLVKTKKRNKGPTSDPQIVTCHNCNESFTSKVRLKFHMQFHEATNMRTDSGAYRCATCDTTFARETALFDHVHFQHHKQRRWQCPVDTCKKTFYLRATLTKHSRTHTDTRRYVCGTCGKRFLDKQTLDEHGVTHLQIKPFQCHVCLKQLTRRSRLRMHLRAHEASLKPRLVPACAVCGAAFRRPQDAAEHLTKSPACLEQFTSELKQEEAAVQLCPTSGLVRAAEPPKPHSPSPRAARGPEAEALLAQVADEARPLTRIVQIEKAFRCEYCEDVFYCESGLNNHRVIHKGIKNPFTCHICKVSFATYSRCTTHKTTHGFYKRSLADAKKQADRTSTEAGPSATGILGYGDFPVVKHFLCEDCGRSYLHWTYLQVHRRMKHANDNFMYKCNLCALSFPNSWGLSYHKKKVHAKTAQGETEYNGNKTTKETNDYRIPCRDCDEVLPNKTALYKHRKKEHSDMSLKNNNGMFWCGYCSRRYCTRAELDVHAKSHHMPSTQGDNPNLDATPTCGACQQVFPTHEELSTHARTHVSHACSVCGHAFHTLSMLAEHAKVHTGDKPFPCDVCGVAFRRVTAMRNHRLLHCGVQPWAAPRRPARRPALRVIEVLGMNPSPEEVMERLTANNIPHDKVIEITKMSFPKGTTSIVPNSSRALEMLSHVPRAQVACSRSRPERPFELYQPTRDAIAKAPRKPKILQRGGHKAPSEYTVNVQTSGVLCTAASSGASGPLCNVQPDIHRASAGPEPTTSKAVPASYPIAVNVSGENLSELNVQMLLREGILVNGNQMVQLQLDDSMLLE